MRVLAGWPSPEYGRLGQAPVPASLAPLVEQHEATDAQLEKFADGLFKLRLHFSPPDLLKGGDAREFVNAMLATKIMYYGEVATASETPEVTSAMLTGMATCGLAGPNADATLRRWGAILRAHFMAANLPVTAGRGSGLDGALEALTATMQQGFASMQKQQQQLVSQIAALTAENRLQREAISVQGGQITALMRASSPQRAPRHAAAGDHATSLALEASATATASASSRLSSQDHAPAAAADAADSAAASAAAAAAAASSSDLPSRFTAAASSQWPLRPSGVSTAPVIISAAGYLAATYYTQLKAGVPPSFDTKDESRVKNAKLVFDMVASAEQRAVLTASSASSNPERELEIALTVEKLHRLVTARFALVLLDAGKQVPSFLIDNKSLKVNGVDDRLASLKKITGVDHRLMLTGAPLVGPERERLLAWVEAGMPSSAPFVHNGRGGSSSSSSSTAIGGSGSSSSSSSIDIGGSGSSSSTAIGGSGSSSSSAGKRALPPAKASKAKKAKLGVSTPTIAAAFSTVAAAAPAAFSGTAAASSSDSTFAPPASASSSSHSATAAAGAASAAAASVGDSSSPAVVAAVAASPAPAVGGYAGRVFSLFSKK